MRGVNADGSKYGTEGGNDTTDKVYLLSIDEVLNSLYGFTSTIENTKTRESKNTAYVAAGGEINSSWMSDAGSTDPWCLRLPGYFSSFLASCVLGDGYVYEDGYGVKYSTRTVRPALHLNLSFTSGWSYAGTVSSDESAGTPLPAPTPGTLSQPGISYVTSFAPQQGSAVTPVSGISPDSGKNTIGKVTDLKLKQKKNTVTTSWKKQIGVEGYQVCYSIYKNWKGKKQKLVSKNNAVIKKLKEKKTYYFRVRAYRLEGEKNVYGAWSKIRIIKIRK